MGIKILIVDDESSARVVIRHFLQSMTEIDQIAEASGVREGIEYLNLNKIDLLFLDIEMQDGTGFDLLDAVPNLEFQVIFTTSHDEFAIKAFRYHAIDYLLKPVDPDEFKESVQKVITNRNLRLSKEQLEGLSIANAEKNFERITLATSNGLVFTKTNDISHIESYGNYTFVYLASSERHLVSKNLKEFNEMLPQPPFFRTHQSFILNTEFVKKISTSELVVAIMNNGFKVPIARRKKDIFLGLLKKP
jgi:two-component system, LytTR family, response regulator